MAEEEKVHHFKNKISKFKKKTSENITSFLKFAKKGSNYHLMRYHNVQFHNAALKKAFMLYFSVKKLTNLLFIYKFFFYFI